jgi:hypothetical protein
MSRIAEQSSSQGFAPPFIRALRSFTPGFALHQSAPLVPRVSNTSLSRVSEAAPSRVRRARLTFQKVTVSNEQNRLCEPATCAGYTDLFVDVLPVTNLQDVNDQYFILNLIHNPVTPLPYSVVRTARQLFASVGPWIGGQLLNVLYDALSILLGANRTNLFLSTACDKDLITGHLPSAQLQSHQKKRASQLDAS